MNEIVRRTIPTFAAALVLVPLAAPRAADRPAARAAMAGEPVGLAAAYPRTNPVAHVFWRFDTAQPARSVLTAQSPQVEFRRPGGYNPGLHH